MENAIDITNESMNKLVEIYWNDKELKPLGRDISLLKKAINKKYVYSDVQWIELFLDLTTYMAREEI